MAHDPRSRPPAPVPFLARLAGSPSLFENAALALAVVDGEGRLSAVNTAFRRQLGEPDAPLAGERLADVLGVPSSLLAPLAAIAAGRRSLHRIEARVSTGGAHRTWGSLTLASLGAGAPVLALLEDVSERHRFEEEQLELRVALGKAASEWRATFDAIEMPIFILSETGRVTRLNRPARDLADLPFRDLLGRDLDQLGDDELWRSASALVARVVESWAAEQIEIREQASDRTWFLAASPSRPDLSSERSIILTAKELTGVARLQESLRRTETMAAMGSLLAGVAHEVRNPLFGISAVVDALERRIEGHEELRRHLSFLRRELGRMEKLMADLLDYGRPVSREPQPTRLEELVEEAVQACQPRFESAGVRIERRRAEVELPVAVDRQRTVQAIVNVLENAAHFAGESGRVVVATTLVGSAGRRWCALRVHDSGPGFDPEHFGRVFEPFYSRRKGGTGLGLPIVARVLDLHGGTVEVANHPEGGGVVELRFPVRDEGSGTEGGATFDFRTHPHASPAKGTRWPNTR